MFWTPVNPAGLLLSSNMSDETASAPDPSPSPEGKAAPRVRRISTPRPKKAAKKALPAEAAPDTAHLPSIPFPTSHAPDREEHSESPVQAGADWPEPEAASIGGNQSPAETAKRKRRRRKGKGQSNGPQNAIGPATEEDNATSPTEQKSAETSQEQRPRPNQGAQQQQQPQRPKIDPALLTKMAWKIYLAEVSEEGVALIGDNDAKDLSRRCFRLAEIFIEEQSRRR